MEKLCTHIIIRDKFTSGYINFFKKYGFEYNHVFITFEGDYPLNLDSDSNVCVLKSYNEIVKTKRKLLNDSDVIVLAAFFDDALNLLRFPQKTWNKIYIQFWGGDIYRFKQKRNGLINILKQNIVKNLVKKSINKCAGVLTLVEGDYDELKQIFNEEKRHQVAQVPDDFYEINHLDYSKLNIGNTTGVKQIMIGNSATQENKHLEMFDILKTKDGCFDVVVPLSYGDIDYKEEILKAGKDDFKGNFKPIVDFMKREDYIKMLSTMDIAIFNNDRQQATGNMIILFNLGKKLYLRSDTSMWPFFKKYGFVIHDVNELAICSIDEITTISEDEKNANFKALKNLENEGIEQWGLFFLQK